MERRLAIIVRDRQSEAFRMSIGLTILEDRVEVYLTRPLDAGSETTLQLEGLREVGIPTFSTISEDSGFLKIPFEEMADRILKSDHIIVY